MYSNFRFEPFSLWVKRSIEQWDLTPELLPDFSTEGKLSFKLYPKTTNQYNKKTRYSYIWKFKLPNIL